ALGSRPAQADVKLAGNSAVVASASQEQPDEVVLASRLSAAIERTQNAVDRSEARIDDGQYGNAATSLLAVAADVIRVHRAAVAQMSVPVDEEAPASPGPDSVVAALTFEQSVVTRLAGLFDTVTNPAVLARLNT